MWHNMFFISWLKNHFHAIIKTSYNLSITQIPMLLNFIPRNTNFLFFKKTILALSMMVFFILSQSLVALAAMQSQNYVIYDSVMHTFDGPVISGIAASVSGQTATVTWNTDILADGFVIYDTDSGFATAKETGSSVKNSSSHSVAVKGLLANTTYYFKVRSERVNGGIATSELASPNNRFTTGSDTVVVPPAETPVTQTTSGGGMLIIDKTDKVPPAITGVSVQEITSNSAKVTWNTSEAATGFVEYGLTAGLGATYGLFSSTTAHSIILENLEPLSLYNFRALSSDAWGNVGRSDISSFTTLVGTSTGEAPIDTTKPVIGPDGQPIIPPVINTDNIVLQYINRLFPEVSLNKLGANPLTKIISRNDITNLIGAPILSGEPRISITATQAKVSWATDIKANSIVAVAPEAAFKPNANEPYQQIVGSPEVFETTHEVNIFGLSPDTNYHFQLRSKPELGPTARSKDYTFRTSLEELSITSFFSKIVDAEQATFKWVTNKDANSAVTFTPYLDNVLAVDQSKTVKDDTDSAIHEILIKEFVGGTQYFVELISQDKKGNVARENFERFSTIKDDNPPEISHIKTDSTIFVDRGNRIQTIVSWTTNKPATSKVYFQEGVHGGETVLSESTSLNTNYVKEHVMVITKFKPGMVYSFRVESADSGGNLTLSKLHTFMTAKKSESIIQIIMNILENTFGWLKTMVK